jgi:hypothetical protein
MENLQSCCFVCKQEIETQSIAIQTECTDTNDHDIIHFNSPGSCFEGKSSNLMIKLTPCAGDISEMNHFFSESDISSILDETSKSHSFFSSFIGKDECFSPPTEKVPPKSSFKSFSKKFLSPQNLSSKVKFFSNTPSVSRFLTGSEGGLDESYEEMMTSLGQTDGLKESFIQLIQVEKLSLRLQLKRGRLSSGKF